MRECTIKIGDLSMPGENDFTIAYPLSAMYFITVAPAGKLKRGEKLIAISDEENLEIAMAVANGHAAYAWWKTYGDAFHVNPHEMETIPIPDKWIQDPEMKREARHLGRELMGAINEENTGTNITGTNSIEQDSLNLHACAPDTIRAIDRLYLKALVVRNP